MLKQAPTLATLIILNNFSCAAPLFSGGKTYTEKHCREITPPQKKKKEKKTPCSCSESYAMT